MINGVIFDMDGLMFDTERMWATFWEPALAALGLEYKEGLAEAERGTAGETSRNIVRQFYGEDCDANAIIDSLHRVADEEFQKPVPKKPGLDELLAWLPKNHPGAGEASFPLCALENEPFIITMPNQDTEIDRLLGSRHLTPDIRFSTADAYTTYCMVEAGLGMSLNNRLITLSWSGDVVTLPFDPPQFVSLGIGVPSWKEASPAMKKFIECVKDMLEELP